MFAPKLTNKESFEKPAEILYADSPKALAATQGIRKIPITKVEAMTNLTWTETNLLPNDTDPQLFLQNISNQVPTKPATFQRIVQQIKENSSKLVLTKMGKYGYGVFSCTDIPANTYIANSTGMITLFDKVNPDEESGTYLIQIGKNIVINARKAGNIARFFQHLPSASDTTNNNICIDTYKFSQTPMVPGVATANIDFKQFFYKNQIFQFVITNCPISKGDIIGWDYGLGYWSALKMAPILFFKNGQAIDQSIYKINKAAITVQYMNKFADCYISLEELEEQPEKLKDIKLSVNEELMLVISEQAFRKKYNANPRSPFCFFESPSRIIESTVVKDELNRIGACLQLPAWKYENQIDTAYIESADHKNITLLGTYLKEKGCTIEYKDNNTLLVVRVPNPDKLKQIEAMFIDNQPVMQMG